MKTKTLFLLLPLMAMVSCNQNEPKTESSSSGDVKFNILFGGGSPYIDWYFGSMESFVSYSFRQFPQDVEGKQHINVRGDGDNTITLKDDKKIRIHDEYSLMEDGGKTTLQLTRTANLLYDNHNAPLRIKKDDGGSGMEQTYTYTINTATPINIIRPEINECHAIPLCYYEGMEIDWNADQTNANGIVIVAEWNGPTLYGPSQDTTIVNVDIVNDTGTTILNTDLFSGIPENALVHLWLIRGDIITINGDDDLSVIDVLENSPEVIEELLSENPELLIQLQPFMFGTGAVATFSFYLIRNLN